MLQRRHEILKTISTSSVPKIIVFLSVKYIDIDKGPISLRFRRLDAVNDISCAKEYINYRFIDVYKVGMVKIFVKIFN